MKLVVAALKHFVAGTKKHYRIYFVLVMKRFLSVHEHQEKWVILDVEETPGLPISRRSLKLGIPQTSLHRGLYKDLGLKAYEVQLTQELKPADHQQHRVFADWVLEMHKNYTEFHRKIILTDKVHFHLTSTSRLRQ